MNSSRLRVGLCGAGLVLLLVVPCNAGDYKPTPLTKTIKDHEWIVVARVVERAGGRATVSVLETVKGKGLPKSLSLPDTWRAGTEFSFGPIRLTKEKTYLLFLKKTAKQQFRLSDDFASKGVTPIENVDAPMVRAVKLLTSLVGNRSRAQRLQTLSEAWRTEKDDCKLLLIKEFYNWKDDVTVPFLVQALHSKDYSVQEHAHVVIGRHKFTAATPTLIELLRKKKNALAARTLGELKAQQAFDALMEAARDDKFPTNRYWALQALGRLDDKRAIPLLLDRLKEGVPSNTGRKPIWGMEQELATEQLARMKVAAAVDPLIAILRGYRSFDWIRRTRIIFALGKIGAPAEKAIPLLREIAPNPAVREATIDKIAAREAIEKIQADKAARATKK